MNTPTCRPCCTPVCRPAWLGASMCGVCHSWMSYPTTAGPVYFHEIRDHPITFGGETCRIGPVIRVFCRQDEHGRPVVTGFLSRIEGDETRLLRQMRRYNPEMIEGAEPRDWTERWLCSTKDTLRRLVAIPAADYPPGLVRIDGMDTLRIGGLALVTARVERLRQFKEVRGHLAPANIRQLALDLGETIVATSRAGITLVDIKIANLCYHEGRFRHFDVDAMTHAFKSGEFTEDTAAPEMLTAPFLPRGFKSWQDERPLRPNSDLYPWAVSVLRAAGLGRYPTAAQRLAAEALEVPAAMDPALFSPPLPAELVPLLRTSLHLLAEKRPTIEEFAQQLACLRPPTSAGRCAAVAPAARQSLLSSLESAWNSLRRLQP